MEVQSGPREVICRQQIEGERALTHPFHLCLPSVQRKLLDLKGYVKHRSADEDGRCTEKAALIRHSFRKNNLLLYREAVPPEA